MKSMDYAEPSRGRTCWPQRQFAAAGSIGAAEEAHRSMVSGMGTVNVTARRPPSAILPADSLCMFTFLRSVQAHQCQRNGWQFPAGKGLRRN
jgi:hypothetical protein